jgi:hypothetical protein
MILPTVTEIPPRLEPVTPDSFIVIGPKTPPSGGRRPR